MLLPETVHVFAALRRKVRQFRELCALGLDLADTLERRLEEVAPQVIGQADPAEPKPQSEQN